MKMNAECYEQSKLDGDEQGALDGGDEGKFLDGNGQEKRGGDRISERDGDWLCGLDVEKLGGFDGGLAAVTSGTTSSVVLKLWHVLTARAVNKRNRKAICHCTLKSGRRQYKLSHEDNTPLAIIFSQPKGSAHMCARWILFEGRLKLPAPATGFLRKLPRPA